jgi:hypothetical protein
MLRGWPSAKHASESRSIHENLERILWLRKRRRRKRPRRRRSRKPRRSEFWPGWRSFSSARAPNSGYDFGERRALGPPFWFLGLRRPCERRDPYAAARRNGQGRRGLPFNKRECRATPSVFHRTSSREPAIWVPAFAGTTSGEGLRSSNIHATRCEALNAPQKRAWRRARQIRRRSCGATRPSPAGG